MRVVVVPGMGGSEPEHWQSAWQRELGDRAVRIAPRSFDAPDHEDWLAALDAVAGPDAVIVAHSLGVLLTTEWLSTGGNRRAAGAMLVGPPDPLSPTYPELLTGFQRVEAPLGVPALVVASSDDRHGSLPRARGAARAWGAAIVELAGLGHINVESGVGDWPEGRRLLTAFLAGLGTG